MTTRRERLESKLEKRRDWAASRASKSASESARASEKAKAIPLGQPMMPGHHSYKRDRKYREGIGRGFERAHEHAQMADHHRAKASGLEAQLEQSIFSDDPDAIEQLERRIASLEHDREQMKRANRAYKRGGIEAVRAECGDAIALQGARTLHIQPYHKAPFPSYALTNIGSNIRRYKQRIESVKAQQARAEQAEKSGGLVINRGSHYASITFAEKPERSVINDLKAAGFGWGEGRWSGRSSAIPASVLELEREAQGPAEPAEDVQ